VIAGCASVRVHDPSKEVIRGRQSQSVPGFTSWADIYPFPILDGQTREVVMSAYKQNGVDVAEQRGWLYGQGRGWVPPDLDTNSQTQQWIERQSGRAPPPPVATPVSASEVSSEAAGDSGVQGSAYAEAPAGAPQKIAGAAAQPGYVPPAAPGTAIPPPRIATPSSSSVAVYGGTEGALAPIQAPQTPAYEWNGDLGVVWFKPGAFELTQDQIAFLRDFAAYNSKAGSERVLYVCTFEARSSVASKRGLDEPRTAVINGTLQAYGFNHNYIRPCDEPSTRVAPTSPFAHTEIRAGGSAQTLTFLGGTSVNPTAIDRIRASAASGVVKVIPNGDPVAGTRLAQVASRDLQSNLGSAYSGFSIAPVLPGPDTAISVELK
jgi:hypothetical protein